MRAAILTRPISRIRRRVGVLASKLAGCANESGNAFFDFRCRTGNLLIRVCLKTGSKQHRLNFVVLFLWPRDWLRQLRLRVSGGGKGVRVRGASGSMRCDVKVWRQLARMLPSFRLDVRLTHFFLCFVRRDV